VFKFLEEQAERGPRARPDGLRYIFGSLQFLYGQSFLHASFVLFASDDDDSTVFINKHPLYFVAVSYHIPQLFLSGAEVSILLVTVRSE
jgi:hypothetical protein